MKTETIQKLHPRAWEIYQMKQSGKSTEDVARHYQIRRDLVHQRCKLIRESLEKPDEWSDGLSTRAVNLCKELNLQSKSDLLAVYESGKILETLNYGRKTHREVADFLGIEATEYLQVPRKTRKALEIVSQREAAESADEKPDGQAENAQGMEAGADGPPMPRN